MEHLTKDWLSGVLKKYENRPDDEHRWGVVRAVNIDGSLSVQLGEGEPASCSAICEAEVGDVVFVVVTKNGSCIALGKREAASGGSSSAVLGQGALGSMVLGRSYTPSKPSGSAGLPEVSESDDGKVLMVVGGQWAAANLPVYSGSYEATPTAAGFAMRTAGAYMEKDVTVNAIPYFETSNTSGGNTIYIASEV